MIINNSIYICGLTGGAEEIAGLLKAGKTSSYYYVYKTGNSNYTLQIGTYHMMALEKSEPLILGAALSKQMAKKIVCRIVEDMYTAEDK